MARSGCRSRNSADTDPMITVNVSDSTSARVGTWNRIRCGPNTSTSRSVNVATPCTNSASKVPVTLALPTWANVAFTDHPLDAFTRLFPRSRSSSTGWTPNGTPPMATSGCVSTRTVSYTHLRAHETEADL
eukprot:444488-Rhodomonas_salina.1